MKIFHLKTQKKGLDLVSEILPENNGLDPKKVKRCTHSNTPYLRKTLRLLNISSHDSIIDIGCSKGAALICMNEFPFKQIDGLEISTNLAKIAKANIAKLSFNKIKIYNVNALDYSNYNQNNIFYFYNPLFPEALKKVLENILTYAKDEELVFIYNNPEYAYIFEDLHYSDIRLKDRVFYNKFS